MRLTGTAVGLDDCEHNHIGTVRGCWGRHLTQPGI